MHFFLSALWVRCLIKELHCIVFWTIVCFVYVGQCCDGSCPTCEQQCGKVLACKNHKCSSRCHRGKVIVLRKGAQWLSGKVLDLRPKGGGFKSLQRHCVVSLILA